MAHVLSHLTCGEKKPPWALSACLFPENVPKNDGGLFETPSYMLKTRLPTVNQTTELKTSTSCSMVGLYMEVCGLSYPWVVSKSLKVEPLFGPFISWL